MTILSRGHCRLDESAAAGRDQLPQGCGISGTDPFIPVFIPFGT
jgi:hypothetical protein